MIAPTLLRTTDTRPWSVRLTWNASLGDVAVAVYRVWRSTKNDDGTIGEVDGNTLAFKDIKAWPWVLYTYCVFAVDANGNMSEQSNSVAVRPRWWRW